MQRVCRSDISIENTAIDLAFSNENLVRFQFSDEATEIYHREYIGSVLESTTS